MADKKRSDPDWEDIRVFIALARYGSLSATARALGLTHATVSRRVRTLEETLGERLVERRPDGYRLTPAGQRVMAPAIEMEAASGRVGRGEGGPLEQGLRGVVRVNAPPSLAQRFVVPALARFAARHPGLDLDVVGDLRTVSLERRETDIAIRYERPRDGDVIAKPLAEMGFGFYATKAWQRRLADGAAPVFTGFDEANAHLPEALWLARSFPRARCVLRTSSQLAQAEAAATGLAIALLPHFAARGHGRLAPCALDPAPPTRVLWLVRRRLDRENAVVQAVWDFLLQVFEEEKPGLLTA